MHEFNKFASRLYEARSDPEDGHELTPRESGIVDKIASATEFSYLDHGSGRIVLRNEDTVVKFARGGDGRHEDGRQQNKAEVKIWEEHSDCRYLAPPTNWDPQYKWVKFPYIPQISTLEEFDEHDAVRAATQIKNHIRHIDELNMMDIRKENVGVYDDEQLKIIDYGSIDSDTD